MRPLLLSLLLLICMHQVVGQNDAPNILLIIADELGIDVLNGYDISGDKPVTPHLDWSCNDGILNGDETSIDQCDEVLSTAFIDSGDVVIRPNPSSGSFLVETNRSQRTELSLYSIDGKLISKTHGKGSIRFTQVREGTYLIKVKSKDRIQSSKVIVRK